MDPLTHALSGALIARATAATAPGPDALPVRTRVAAGFVAAAFPDIDIVLRLIDTITYLNWHQGITHAPLMVPLWALLLARLFAWIDPAHHRWQAFFMPACLGLGIHIGGDLITAYGLMLFAPLSTARYSVPLAFVIDPWISAIVVAGLAAGALLPTRRSPAVLALIALLAYLSFLTLQMQGARDVAALHADSRGLPPAAVHVLPQPLSPFNWKLIVRDGDTYHVAHIALTEARHLWPPLNWIDALLRLHTAFRPVRLAQWQVLGRFGDSVATADFARDGWHQPAFDGFRRFAVFPLLERIDKDGEDGEGRPERCAWFVDMRFVLPSMPPSFRYGACRAEGGEWRMYRARGAFLID
ncbi:MAG: metal-dependent hydrolase [Azoarcus sp.]|nr:metal-dependent hydrolase [Azoarcus sp.]